MNSTKMSHIFEKTIPVLINSENNLNLTQYNVQEKSNSYKT